MAANEEYNSDGLKVPQTSSLQARNRSKSIKLVVDETAPSIGGGFDASDNVTDRTNAVNV
jgi:hypothetical protein